MNAAAFDALADRVEQLANQQAMIDKKLDAIARAVNAEIDVEDIYASLPYSSE